MILLIILIRLSIAICIGIVIGIAHFDVDRVTLRHHTTFQIRYILKVKGDNLL